LALHSEAGQVADKIRLSKPAFNNALIELAEQKKKKWSCSTSKIG